MDTKEHILLNHKFFDKLSNVKRIIVFGWSGGDVDLPYLKEIIRNVNNDAKWTVYWYDEKDYKTLYDVFKKKELRIVELLSIFNRITFGMNSKKY